MCDFCHRHGDGKIWYLQAKNYSAELAQRPAARKRLEQVSRFVLDEGTRIPDYARRLKKAPRAVRWLVNGFVGRRLRAQHHGQVVPLEDLRVLLSSVVTSVVRLPCICRKGMLGSTPACCLAITAAPSPWEEVCLSMASEQEAAGRLAPPDMAGLERLSPPEALALLEEFESQGLVHTLWTFQTPFIGGLCNCDPSSCVALQMWAGGLDVLAPGEYLAQVAPDQCEGCRECEKRCPFGAVAVSRGPGKARIDPKRCYGCGLCRTVCSPGAITLAHRAAVG